MPGAQQSPRPSSDSMLTFNGLLSLRSINSVRPSLNCSPSSRRGSRILEANQLIKFESQNLHKKAASHALDEKTVAEIQLTQAQAAVNKLRKTYMNPSSLDEKRRKSNFDVFEQLKVGLNLKLEKNKHSPSENASVQVH